MSTDLSSNIGLRSARFRAEREEGWRTLGELVGRVERRGAQSLSFREAQELATLYRQAMTSLSLARAISLDKSLLAFLESLCARAYLAVYAPQESLAGLVSRVYLRGIPQAARRSALPLLIAFLALFLGGLLGYLLFLGDPTWYNTFMPPGLAGGRGLGSSREDLLSVIYQENGIGLDRLAAFASYLFSHNTQIAIFVFSLGVLACLPSFVLTFYNGLQLGAFVALHASRDLTYDIVAWLSIHGVTELGAIVVACGAGFRLGLAVLFPGQRTRKDALHHHGRDAVKLAVLAATMLVAAAILEGFFRQTVQDPALRLAIGWGMGAFWVLYLTFGGRGRA
ncbi:MAG: stage II sporulation protein M [Pseudomonadota bacterium]